MADPKTLTDEELLEMIRQGKQSALVRLHKSCYDGVRNYILKNNGTQSDVEDTMQDALIVTWQKVNAPGFELTSKLSTFVHSVARFIWMNRLRKEGKEIAFHEMPDIVIPAWTERKYNNPELKIVRACMDEIGETCKTLLGYFYFDGFSMDRIASMMDFSNADTAKSKKYQCLKKLESIIKSRYKKEDLL